MWWMIIAATAAAVEPEDRWIGNDNLVIGIHSDGSLINPDLDIGIQWDPDGPEGDIPIGGDMIQVGYEWEHWSWSYTSGDTSHSGTNIGPHDGSDMEMSWEGPWLTDTIHGLRATGASDQLQVDIAMAVSQTADVMWMDYTLTALEDIEELWLVRAYDPDQDYWATSSHSTDNRSGDGYATATGDYDARSIALLGIGPDGLGIGGVCDWCRTPADMVSEAGESSGGDDQPGVAVQIGSLAEGETSQVRFIYGFALGESTALSMSFAWLTEDDMDGDGSTSDSDCDDWDATVSPEAAEIADELDNDCDGVVDEDTVVSDDDGDGWTELDGDCDDGNASVYPGADPVDGVMNADCDGEADTGWWSGDDTGDPGDTGETEDTGTEDTSMAETVDTGLLVDTGTQGTEDTGSGSDTGSGAEAAGEDKPKNSSCGCAAQPSPGSGLGMLSLLLLGLMRRRGDGR
jgi:MYXO-CTERM domain-containing protein